MGYQQGLRIESEPPEMNDKDDDVTMTENQVLSYIKTISVQITVIKFLVSQVIIRKYLIIF